MSEITIRKAKTTADASGLDSLLWHVLWKPLGLSRDVRKGFSIKGEQVELVALLDGNIAGGLIAVWTDKETIETNALPRPICWCLGSTSISVVLIFLT